MIAAAFFLAGLVIGVLVVVIREAYRDRAAAREIPTATPIHDRLLVEYLGRGDDLP